MRAFLGESATQAGSLNAPGRLRFDFRTPGAVSPAVLHDVEQQVNEVLLRDLEVHAFITTQDEARRLVVRGFLFEIIQQIGVPDIEERLRGSVQDELASANY